ncbi:MAG TPA: TonB family protein [Blastocatellia bacterium]|nr:TonB family protein [Blastocatellia bacterium]
MKKKVSALPAALFVCLSTMQVSAQSDAGAAGSDEARKLNAQAVDFYKEGKNEEAVKLQKQALALWEKEVGEEHTLILIGSNNLGDMYRALGRFKEAADAYQRALNIEEKLLGAENPDLAVLIIKLAWMRYGNAQVKEAEALFKRAVAVREKNGADDAGVAEPLLGLAAFYQKIKKPAEAVPIYWRVIAVQEKHFGSEGQPLIETLEQCSCALLEDKKENEAREMEHRAALIEGKNREGPVGPIVAKEAILQGKAIHKEQPHYPPEAMRQRITGSVSIKIEIDEAGDVTEAKILCGGGILAAVSREAALKWRFTPTALNGQPVKVKGILTFNFILQ